MFERKGTGYYDSEGIEIKDGDLLNNEYNVVNEVRFFQGEWSYSHGDWGTFGRLSRIEDFSKIYIIGNIFENPDLIDRTTKMVIYEKDLN